MPAGCPAWPSEPARAKTAIFGPIYRGPIGDLIGGLTWRPQKRGLAARGPVGSSLQPQPKPVLAPRAPSSRGRGTGDRGRLIEPSSPQETQKCSPVPVARASRGSPTRCFALGTPHPCVSRASCPRSCGTGTAFPTRIHTDEPSPAFGRNQINSHRGTKPQREERLRVLPTS